MTPLPRRAVRSVARLVPPISRLVEERDRLAARVERQERRLRKERQLRRRAERRLTAWQGDGTRVRQAYPPGHFYSTVPDLDEVRGRHDAIFDRSLRDLPGIDLRAGEQLALLAPFAELYGEQPFGDAPAGDLRYGFANDYFSYGDGLALYSFLRHFRPNRLVEVGSGWSSALALDVNERFFDGAMHCTFLEPYPERLHSLMRPADHDRAEVVAEPLHAIEEKVFAALEPGDLLFIDSTHVSRVGSDINRLFLDVLPSLPPGVHVHVHDVFWPFEYPAAWVYEGRGWNEDYLLRALLVGNSALEITWFNDYLGEHHADEVARAMPLWRNNPGGSIYLRTR